jgi:hypothetical protein
MPGRRLRDPSLPTRLPLPRTSIIEIQCGTCQSPRVHVAQHYVFSKVAREGAQDNLAPGSAGGKWPGENIAAAKAAATNTRNRLW